ncbi:DUF305 domain-containing protein [Mycolicibacterium frederiksbergense]|uniref:DUF305 domain-containing protein n=1 Tax=Mycolicibacterium frederiksbergense TaxID=117567 RepID=A0A6H0RXP3_9MYCO|nr:DUF305 domain-containing protein [Mycolicibacterium frederiksbergense]QIV79730.1 DUF305 domain-containing protein [Mycolicibacterium frederiksbergense]
MQRNRYGYGFVALAASAVVLTACSGGSTTSESSSAASSPALSTSVSTSADASSHNEADVAFAQGMIPHHEQAIEMSDMLLGKQGVDPAVLSLAEEIKAAQAPEIEKMQGWLQQWGASSAPATSSTSTPGTFMPGHDMSGGGMGDMPGMGSGGHGMMSEADMAALQNAPGAEAGKLFLEQMIKHHEGAITMAQQEIDKGQFPDAVGMARTIVTSQQGEIDEMRALLEK